MDLYKINALVAEHIFGIRFWKETRGEYELCVWDYEGKEPWMGYRNKEQAKTRYTQTSALEAVRIGFFGTGIKSYASDIAAAWEVVEKMQLEYGFSLFYYPGLSSNGFGYIAVFALSLRPYSVEIVTLGDPAKVFHGHAESAPLAICLAALKAKGIDIPDASG